MTSDNLLAVMRDLQGVTAESRIAADYIAQALVRRGVLKKAPEWKRDDRWYMVTDEWMQRITNRS
jgi:hypothetical protein